MTSTSAQSTLNVRCPSCGTPRDRNFRRFRPGLAIACDNAAMASLIREKNGTYRLGFIDPRGIRRSLRIGKTTELAAMTFKRNVELILADAGSGSQQPTEVAQWVIRLSPTLRTKLANCGLVTPKPKSASVNEIVQRFTELRSVKPSTQAAYRQTTQSLCSFFGSELSIDRIDTSEAERWQRSLADEGLALATRAKRTIVAKAIFRRAVMWGVITRSPFDHLKAGSQSNPARSFYVGRPQFCDVMDQAPSQEWRALLAACRFGGLRCPSEIRGFRWRDIDMERGAMTVRSPKTESHAGHAVRLVPMDPLVRVELGKLRGTSNDADEIFAELGSQISMRTRFQKFIKRAGQHPWPRLFQNLRASCATDWVQRFPAHEVAKWLGHSPLVAQQHYLMPNDLHFQAATQAGANAERELGSEAGVKPSQSVAQNWRWSGAVTSGHVRTGLNATREHERGCELPGGISQPRSRSVNGRRGTRTPVGVSQQIYSLPSLAT